MPNANPPRPTLLSRLVQRILLWLYRWKGWRTSGTPPASRKCIILGAPHTTNWDFVFFLGFARELGVKPSFMGKTSLFRWPMTRFMHDMGGVPIDRTRSGNYVDAVAATFAARDELALVIAPEGTRSDGGAWRSGFYHIAHRAGVPIVPAWVNHDTMVGGIGPEIMPTGDYAADLAKIRAFYESVLPGHPRLSAIRVSERSKAP